MPSLIDVDEDTEEVILTPTTVPASTSELPILSTALPTTTSTTADTRGSIIRTEDQLIADTETTEPRPSTRGERVINQPLSITMTTAQVSPLPTVTTRPEASDLIWPGHLDAQAIGLFPPTDGERRLDIDERWWLLRPFDQPKVLRLTMDTPMNIRRLNKSDVWVENMQIHEYLTEIPQIGKRF